MGKRTLKLASLCLNIRRSCTDCGMGSHALCIRDCICAAAYWWYPGLVHFSEQPPVIFAFAYSIVDGQESADVTTVFTDFW